MQLRQQTKKVINTTPRKQKPIVTKQEPAPVIETVAEDINYSGSFNYKKNKQFKSTRT